MKTFTEIEELGLLRNRNGHPRTSAKLQMQRFRRSCSESKLHDKYKLIKKMLKRYDELGAENQKQAYEIQIFLQKHLSLLDEIKGFVKYKGDDVRQQRSTILDDYSEQNEYQKEWLNFDSGEMNRISGRYSKLVRTAEFIRKNSLFDNSDHISTYDDYQAFNNYDYM